MNCVIFCHSKKTSALAFQNSAQKQNKKQKFGIYFCMKFLLKTTYPCVVQASQDSVELQENDTLEIEDESKIFVFPIQSQKIPFCIDLVCPKENSLFSILNVDGQKMIFLEKGMPLKTYTSKTLTILSKPVRVCFGGGLVSFETENQKLEYECNHDMQHGEILKIKDFACVKFDEHLYAFSLKTGKLSHFMGKISLDGNILTLEKKFHDSVGRESKTKFAFLEDVVKQDETFQKSSDKSISELLPYKFMESVKAKDFSYAVSLLSDRLKESIDDQTLQEFFGNFSTFMPLSTTQFIILSGENKNFVTFSLKNDKVDDISIDKL